MHAPLWILDEMLQMKHDLRLKEVTFPQCALGSKYEKYTTLWYSAAMAPTLDQLHVCSCRCGVHAEVARGRDSAKQWRTAEAAAYPRRMNEILAQAAAEAVGDGGGDFDLR